MADSFVKTFKGYEDKVAQLDSMVNDWIMQQAGHIEVVDLKIALSHEPDGRAGSGDLIYTILYRAKQPRNG
jgi:hypothetical protein